MFVTRWNGVDGDDGFNEIIIGAALTDGIYVLRHPNGDVASNVPHVGFWPGWTSRGYAFGDKSNGALELSLNIVDALLRSPRIQYSGDTVSNNVGGHYFAEALRLAPAFCDEFVAPLPEAGGIIDFEPAVGWVGAHAAPRASE